MDLLEDKSIYFIKSFHKLFKPLHFHFEGPREATDCISVVLRWFSPEAFEHHARDWAGGISPPFPLPAVKIKTLIVSFNATCNRNINYSYVIRVLAWLFGWLSVNESVELYQFTLLKTKIEKQNLSMIFSGTEPNF